MTEPIIKMAGAFFLEVSKDSAKGETGEKGCIFSTVEMKQVHTMIGPRSCH